jgi:hypothetical protein
METQLINLALSLAGLILGGAIGFGFGKIQNAAMLRHEKKQQSGALKSGWAVMPGSMSRVAFLLIALAAVQILCPIMFAGNIQWLVSAGVVLGYGWTLYTKLRHRTVKA